MAPPHAIQLSRFPHNGHHADLEDDDDTDKPDEESATLLGGRGNEKRDHGHDNGEDDDDVAALRRAQKAARIGVLRELAAYCLKRPHVVCGVFIAAFFLMPIGWGVLFSSRVHLLECNANTTLQMPLHLHSLLSLDEKIGQMVVADLQDLQDGSPVTTRFLGGIISRPGGAPPLGGSPQDWLKTAHNLQAHALQTPHQIPILFGADIAHGHAGVYGATVIPHQIGLGATHNPALLEQLGVAVAEELRATGVRWALGPNLSPCRDPRWGGCYQTFSENERLLRMLNTELVGLSRGGGEGTIFSRRAKNDSLVVVSPLGYMGVGGTTNGLTGGVTAGDDQALRKVFLRSFFDAVSRGVPMIQLGSGSIMGARMHNSTWLMGILKGQLDFQGVVLSGYRGIEALEGDWANQVRWGVNVGIDMFMVGRNQQSAFISTLKKEVEAGRVPLSRIDDAVRRVLEMKVEAGLFRDPCGTRGLDGKTVGSEEHKKLARSAVRESLVLLKNGGGGKPKLLPLMKGGVKVLVAGTGAHNMKQQCGGHTAAKGAVGSTILEGIEEVLGWGGTVTYSSDPKKVDGFDYAIVVVGEEPYEGAEGDKGSRISSMLKLNKRSRTVIIRVCGSTPCVLVLITGRPLFLEPVLPFVDAVVVAWLPGSQGGGVADVLFEGGGHDFVGTLPISWFRRISQLPLNYGDKHYDPLFKYGFGLTLNGTVLDRAFHSKG